MQEPEAGVVTRACCIISVGVEGGARGHEAVARVGEGAPDALRVGVGATEHEALVLGLGAEGPKASGQISKLSPKVSSLIHQLRRRMKPLRWQNPDCCSSQFKLTAKQPCLSDQMRSTTPTIRKYLQ